MAERGKRIKLNEIPKQTHFWLIRSNGERVHVFKDCNGKVRFDHPTFLVEEETLQTSEFEPWEEPENQGVTDGM